MAIPSEENAQGKSHQDLEQGSINKSAQQSDYEKETNGTEQVRGTELKNKMSESKEMGEEYRADHQGSDLKH